MSAPIYILALKGNHSGMQAELEAWWYKCQREGLSEQNYAEQALHAGRSHWQVESMHWMLDMTFKEDEYRSTLLESGIKMR